MERDPNRVYTSSLSRADEDRYGKAINGDLEHQVEVTLPDGTVVSATNTGCLADVRARLYGSVKDWLRRDHMNQAFDREVAKRVLADPAYTGAEKAWGACMRGRGLPYTTPQDARSPFLRTTGSTTEPSDKERKAAVASAECSRETKLTATALRLERHYREAGAPEYDRDVLGYAESQVQAVKRARQLLGVAK